MEMHATATDMNNGQHIETKYKEVSGNFTRRKKEEFEYCPDRNSVTPL
jgi:hypothetical protein